MHLLHEHQSGEEIAFLRPDPSVLQDVPIVLRRRDHAEKAELAHAGEDRAAYEGAVVPPIFQNSLFTYDSWDAISEALRREALQ